jgi:hypothetical protein
MFSRFSQFLLSVTALGATACQMSAPVPMSTRKPGQGSTAPTTSRPEAPKLKRLPNGHYRVKRPWNVDVGGRRWTVPAGYTSNGITGPGKLRSALGDGIQYRETWAAVFHDWLFTQPGISRSTADRLFHELLLAYGVDPGKARMMYSTVSAYSLSKKWN